MANGNELRDLANKLRSEENLSTSQVQRDPRYIAKQEEIAELDRKKISEQASVVAKDVLVNINKIDKEQIKSSVASEYFDLNNLESRDESVKVYRTLKTGETRFDGKFESKYKSDEEYDDYLKSFYRDRYDDYVLFKESGEVVKNKTTDSLSKTFIDAQKSKNSEQIFRNIPKDIRDEIGIDDLTGFSSFEQGGKFIEDQVNLYKKSVEENNKNYLTYKNNFKVFSDKINNIDAELKKISRGDFKMDALDSPKEIERFNELINQRNQIISENQPSLKAVFDDIKLENESLDFMLKNIKDKNSQLNDAAIISKALGKDYRWRARAAQSFEEFFLGSGAEFVGLTSKVLTKLARKTGGGSIPGQIITKGLDYIDTLTEGEVDKMFDTVGNYVLNNATNYNQKLAEKREINLPAPITLDDIGNNNVGYGDWFGEAFANNSPSILIGTVGGGTAIAGRVMVAKAVKKGGKKLIDKAKKDALKYNRASMDTTIGAFFVGETGDKATDMELKQRKALKILPEKKEQLKNLDPNSFEAKNISQQIKDLERISSYSLAHKAFTAYGYGGSAAFFERLPLKFLQEASDYSLKYGKNKFKKEVYNKIPNFTKNLLGKVGYEGGKVLLKGATIEQLEEVGTQIAHNALDIFVLDENKSITSGLDKDFIANNFVTIGAITSPKVAMNMQQAFAHEFSTRDEVLNIRKLRLELDNIRIDIKNSEGQDLLDKRKRKNEILQELALAGATSIQKLNSMTGDQIEEAADIKRQMRELDKLANRIGGAGKKGANTDVEVKKIQQDYEFLQQKLETLLSSQKNKIKKWFDNFIKESADDEGFDLKSGPDAQYHLGLYDFYGDAAKIMMPENGEYIEYTDGELVKQSDGSLGFDLTNFEAVENKLKEKGIDQDAIDEIKAKFSEGANAAQAGNNIIINEKALINNILRGSKGDAKYAAIAPLEELSHLRNRAYGLVDKDGQMTEKSKKAVEEAVKVLNEKKELNRIKEDDYNALMRRLNAYEGDSEEILEQIKNAIVLGLLDISDIETMYGFQDFVRGFVGDVFGEYSWMFDLSDANDVFRFAKNFKRQVEKQQVIASAPEEQEEVKLSKPVGDQIKALVPPGTTKQQYDNQVIGDVYTDLVVGNTLNGLIRGQLNKFGVTGDNVFGKPINNFVEDVKQQLFERSLTRFNPETNDDLGGFVVSELQQFRIGDVVNRYRREQAGSLDVQIGETGSIRTPVADEVDIDIKTTEAPRSELKQGLIVNGERLVDKKLEGEIEANTIEIIEGVTPEINDKDFKTFVKDAAQQKSFKSIKNKLKNIEQFLEDNINVLFGGKNLPIATLVAMERRTPAADRIFTGEPTRLTTQKQIDKAIDEGDFYVENEKQGPSKYPRKKPTIEQVKNFFFNVGASTKGTRKDGLVNAIAFSLFRDMAPGVMNRSNIVQEDIAKISAKLVVDPRVKFSEAVGDIINIRSLLELETKGIDKLLDLYGQNSTFDIKSDTGRTKFIKFIKSNLLPLMPKEFWFSYNKDGDVISSVFTYSNASFGLSMSSYKLGDTIDGKKLKVGDPRIGMFKKPNEAKAYDDFKNKVFAIGNDKNTNFGDGIEAVKNEDGTVTNVDWTLTKKYTTIFGKKDGFVDKIKQGIKNGDIKKWNKNVEIIHKEMWKRFNDAISKDRKGVISGGIGTYLKLVGNDPQAWHRLGAQITGYSNELTKRKPTDKGKMPKGGFFTIEFEHAMPATAAYLYLMDSALSDSNFNTSYDLIIKNYKLIVLDKAMDDKLRNARTKKGYSLQRRMPDDWSVVEGNWWQRYFNDIVYAQDGGIDPSSIIGLDGRTFSETFEVDAAGRSTNKNIETSKKKAFKSNLKQPNVKKYSFSKSASGLFNDLNNHDKALRNARDLNAPRKGISIFDFDDTVATSKSMIIVTMPDGKTKKITPAEFAKQHSALEKQDAEFDFSEFNKVIDGKPGPLAAKIKKQIDKFGNKDVYILTARPQASASAIKAFLDGIGIKLPLKNITGLENGTPQAKANWVISKAADGYNDFYFTDDVYKNVKAVQEALEVLDVKSKTRLAYADRIKKLDKDFNDILEATTGVDSEKEYSKVKAELLRGNKGKYEFFIHASADDFAGMLQRFQGKGVVGDNAKLWFKKNLLDPFATAMGNLSRERIALMNDYDALKAQIGIVPKNLRKKMGEGIFTNEHAVRVYIWNKQGMEVPGLSKRDLKELTKYINENKKFKVFADQLIAIHKADGYPKADSAWVGGTITIDMQNGLDVSSRAKNLQVWEQNVDIIFSDKNLNKIEALYGQPLREALTGMIKRMKTGKNRSFQSDTLTGKTVDFLNGAVGGVMFFNSRSSVLQTISLVNFINYEDNNIFAASKAFANQKQFWKDFKNLMNSDFLIDRRRGVRFSLNENDIANIAQKHGARGVIARALEIGFLPTQIADSFAIAVGGASFYRNRINTYKKQGLSDQQAEAKAFQDFREIAEETQQSSRPDRVSQQQAGPMGRLLLAFQNVTMQFNRVAKKNFLDLKNKRRVLKSDGTFHSLNKSRQIQLSKVGYYIFVQNLIFNGLQKALFALYFGDVDEEDEKFKKKYIEISNSMLDSVLRGTGIFGGAVSVVKNAAIMYQKQAESKNPKYEKVGLEILKVSPPISSKISKIVSALTTLDWEKEEIKEKGFSIDNPALLSATKLISAFTNAPLDRVVIKTNNIATALGQQLELWERIALLGGWQDWELGIEDEPEETKGKVKFGETRQTRKKRVYKKRRKKRKN